MNASRPRDIVIVFILELLTERTPIPRLRPIVSGVNLTLYQSPRRAGSLNTDAEQRGSAVAKSNQSAAQLAHPVPKRAILE